MIQRKQTLFLLAAVILSLVHYTAWPLVAIQVIAAILGIWAIFTYQKRKRQAALCLTCVLVNLIWYLVLCVLIQQGKLPEQMPVTACLPLVCAILCFLARKGVLDDEKLVRAADRIR